MSQAQHDLILQDWKNRQEIAEEMLPLLGRLYRDRGLVLLVYGRPIVNSSTIEILKAHRYVRYHEGAELDVADTLAVLKAIAGMDVAPARLDIGKLAVGFRKAGTAVSLADYLGEQLADIVGDHAQKSLEPKDVVLFGFGRIGRLLARLLIERTGAGNKLRLRAIVVRKGKGADLQKRASLLRRDSVHGPFNGSITVDEENNAIIANGNFIKVIYADKPGAVDLTEYEINDALIVDNTGKWADLEGLNQHLSGKGAKKVLLTAPSKGDGIKNIVYGVNHGTIEDSDLVVSAASCTTNAITPVLKALNDKYGIENGHVETVHSYTNDQNLIDNYHKSDRRGRAAPLNMVITSTGAAKAVAKALPELKGKLTGNAIRVPTPNVSMAILSLNLQSEVTKDGINEFLRETALHSKLSDQIDYTASTELVSTDIVGSRHAGVVDSQATIAADKRVVLYVWYDNEFGYSCQVVRVMQEMVGIRLPNLPH